MQKKTLKNWVYTCAEGWKFHDFFSKEDQPNLPYMGQIMFLVRWCNIAEFSCMGESFILRILFWNNGLPVGWSGKNKTNVKKL
jgi:hypothetical protein